MEPRRPINKDDTFYQRLLDRCSQSLIVDLDPTPLLDTCLSKEVLEYTKYRDIKELQFTSEKNRAILQTFRSRGRLGYEKLKQCLKKAEQRHLVDTLLKAELELERITEMEQKQTSEQREASGMELSQRIPSDRDLMVIAGFIGMNWEFLGPSLGVPTSQIDHFKMNFPGNVKMQIYRMLLEWRQSSVSPPTMGRLLEILKSARSYVNMEWEKIEGIANSPAMENRQNNQQWQGDLPSNMGNPRKGGLAPTKRENNSSSISSTAHYPGQYPVSSGDQQMTQYKFDETGAGTQSTSLQEAPYPFANTRRTGENNSNLHRADLSGQSNMPDAQVNSVSARPDGDNVDAAREQSYEHETFSQKSAKNTPGNFDPRQQPMSGTPLYHPDILLYQRIQSNQAVSPVHAIGQMEEGLHSLKLYFTGTPSASTANTPIASTANTPIASTANTPISSTANTPISSTANNPSASTVPGAGNTSQTQLVTAVLPEDNTDSSRNVLKPEIKERVVKELRQLPYDGRLLTYSIETFKYIIGESRGTLKGGFGTVYIHSKKLEGLGIPVVVKVIECKETEKRREKMMSVTNEKLASRTMHYSIVPLLAMTEDTGNSTFYFLTPYLENGNLRDAIEKDTETLKAARVGDPTAVELNSRRRLKIIYQIHAALHFLHTPVPGFRGTIVHMDLKSMNIVLDKYYNARLIDFGLAREMNETDKSLGVTDSEVPGTIGYRPTAVYSRLTVKDDWHNFGIVIRELLTGKPAYDDKTQKLLRRDDVEAVFDDIQGIWYVNMDPSNEASKLNEIAGDCISKEIDTSQLKEDIENLLGPQTNAKWERSEGDDKCEMCMINKKASIPQMLFVHNNNCTSNISVCVACMRNTFLNPIICHTCDKIITPIIGYGWEALLLAGNDVGNPKLAEGFDQDISKVFDVLISKCPLVMGIGERNVQVVKPSKPGCPEKLLYKFDEAVETLIQKGNIRTLLIYFSGHFYPGKGFLLGDEDEFLPVETLEKKMETIAAIYKPEVESPTSISDTRFLIFLDCCAGPKLTSETDAEEKDDCDKNMEVGLTPNIVGKKQSCESMQKLPELKLKENKQCIIQLNACRHFQVTRGTALGSAFTEFFVQALTQRALGTICRHGSSCKNCDIQGDFITIHDLHNYIYKHMLEDRKQGHPVRYENEVLPYDSVIAYNVDFHVQLEFRLKNHGHKKSVPLKMYSKIGDLKSHLFRNLMETMYRGNPEFNIDDYMPFVESICIEIDKGPKVTEELDTVPKIMAAWNARRDLAVSLRTDDNIHRGMILKVMSAVQTVGSGDIGNVQVVNEILMSLSSGKIQTVDSQFYKSVILPVNDLRNMIRDLRQASGSLAEFVKCLVSVRSCITANKLKTDGRSELHVMFSKPLKDFICFELKI